MSRDECSGGLANFPNASGKAYAVVPYGCGVSFGGMKE